MKRRLILRSVVAGIGLGLVSLGLIAIAMAVGGIAAAAPGEQASPTLRLYAGDGEGIIAMNDFRLPSVRVAEGTTITWVMNSDEFHTVTFLAGRPRLPLLIPQPEDPSRPPMANPELFFPTLPSGPYDGTTYVNSGFMEQRGAEMAVTFGRPGRYEYVCLLHPPMTGVVEVVAAGTSGLTTQAEVDAYHVAHTNQEHLPQLAELLALRSAAVTSPGPGGSTVHMVRSGTEWRFGHLDLMAYLPDTLTVQQGDTVVWFNDHGYIPHTVTFPEQGAEPLDFLVPALPDGTILSGPPSGPPAGGAPPRSLPAASPRAWTR